MCLGMPAEVVEVTADRPDLAIVDMNGARHVINVGLLEEGEIAAGSWVLVHLGFAMRCLSEEEATEALSVLGFSATPRRAGEP